MADAQPVAAATLQEIKAAFPKAKSDFVIKCLEKSLPMASVAQAAVEEMMAENEMLKAQIKAMQDEMAGKPEAVAEGVEIEVSEDEEEIPAAPVAKAKRVGVAPVARGQGVKPSARADWSSRIDAKLALGMKRDAAIMAVEREAPGLREAVVAEANKR